MGKRSADPVDGLVGRSIRVHRLAAGMSQTDLGQKIGVTFQQVQKYEKGTNRVGAGRLTRIAHVLDVSVSTLFQTGDASDDAREPKGDSPLKLLAEPHALRLLQAFGEITDRKARLAIVALIEAMAAKRR